MGMFDRIKDKIYCPYCGNLSEQDEYQTKDLSCMLDSWTIDELEQFCDKFDKITFYSECKNCKKWVEIILNIERNEND